MRLPKVAMSLALALGLAGCAAKPAAPLSRVLAPTANETWEQSLYGYDDPRANADDTRAMQAAAKALLGPTASEDTAKDLRFAVTIVGPAWEVDVWRVAPGTTLGVGNFQAVTLDHDFKVEKVSGGA